MGSFRGHVFQICCDNVLYMKMLQVQVEKGLGKAFAGMLVNVEGLYAMGYLDEEQHDLYKNKYSVGLAEAKANMSKSPVQIAKEQSRVSYCKTARKEFGNVLNQWTTMKQKNKAYWVKKANLPENANIQNAKLVLELAEQEKESLTLEG